MKSLENALKLKKELDSWRPMSPENEDRVFQKLRLDWNYHSNNIEGNTLTYGETRALILHGITAQGKPLKDHFEITGHNEAIKWVLDIVKETRPLTEQFIRELHKLLLKESYYVDAQTPDGKATKKKIEVGKYKSSANHVRTKTGEIFMFAFVEDTPIHMGELIEWFKIKKETKDVNPILLAAEFHYKFIRIHPFDDGNGRTARILMNFILLLFGYPPAVIKTEEKNQYFSVLEQADAGTLEPFIDFIAGNVARSMELMIAGAKGLRVEEPDDIDKEMVLLEKRLSSMTQKVNVTKSKESINSIYKDSVLKLIEKYTDKNELFKKHYLNYYFSLVAHADINTSVDNLADCKKINLPLETRFIKIEYRFDTFNHKGLSDLSFSTGFKIEFNKAKYLVNNTSDSIRFEKHYDETLSDDEISELINSEAKRHFRMIDEEIKNFN